MFPLPTKDEIAEILRSANINFDSSNIKKVYHDQTTLFQALNNNRNSNATVFAGFLMVNPQYLDKATGVLNTAGIYSITPLLGLTRPQGHIYITPSSTVESVFSDDLVSFCLFSKLGTTTGTNDFSSATTGVWTDFVTLVDAYNNGVSGEKSRLRGLIRFYGWQIKVNDARI